MTWQQVTLIVPTGPNVPDMNVKEYDSNLAELELALIAHFGGLTAVDGRGAWQPEVGDVLHEPVRIFTLAAQPRPVELAWLRQHVKMLLDQRAVYLAAYDLAEKPVQ